MSTPTPTPAPRVRRRFGSLEVLGPLGRGGMGEVYRARDSRLGREVALKLLPDDVAADPERLARLRREARLLATLQHPNVATLYSVEEEDGAWGLVMECVEGATLAERLDRGPLPLDEALDLAMQVAAGVDAAHRADVVHRDLKPANVIVTPEGVAKVLDFGLAKSCERAEAGATDGSTPQSFVATSVGVALGTPTYMSPEQARGRAVDRRTDVWAFGCVLFEMLTATRAFPAEDAPDALAQVLRGEPDWGALPASTPRRVVDLLERCLAKDPRSRLRDLGDARLELERMLTGALEPAGEVVARRGSRAAWVVAAVALAAGAAAWIVAAGRRAAVPGPSPVAYEIPYPLGEMTPEGGFDQLSVSPDGRALAFVAWKGSDAGIWVKDAGEPGTRRIARATRGSIRELRFEADGRAFRYQQGGASWRQPMDGGPPVPSGLDGTCSDLVPMDGGHAVVRQWGDPVGFVPDGATEPTVTAPLERDAGDRGHAWVDASGSLVAYAIWSGGPWDQATIGVLDVATGRARRVVEGGTMPKLVETEHGTLLVWARGGALWAGRLDPRELTLVGPGVLVRPGVSMYRSWGNAWYDVSDSGLLAFAPGIPWERRLALSRLDRDGRTVGEPLLSGPYSDVEIAGDGRLVLTREGPLYSLETAVLGPSGLDGPPRPLAFEGDCWRAALAPDGSFVVYAESRAGDYRVVRRGFEPGAQPTLVLEANVQPKAVSPDGAWLVFESYADDGPAPQGLWRLPLDGSGPPERLVPEGVMAYEPAISPDGRWIAYSRIVDDSSRVFLAAFPSGSGARPVPIDLAFDPLWSPDGSELYVFRSGEFVSCGVAGDGPTLGAPRVLFEDDRVAGWGSLPGGGFLVTTPDEESDEHPDRVVVIHDWVRSEVLPALSR